MAKSAFRGGPPGGGMNMNMIKQAQKMQAELLRTQSEMEEREFSATSGGGAVTAVVSGKHELLKLDISPDAVDPEDVEILSDMIIAAINEAMRTAEKAAAENISRLTGGLNLGSFGL
ncbi:MAG: YbaB/EbfC family nucleoid-associated protein [Oscillospiraceae bacterium]|jgi:DNA-binding YbaB/EbfC family protein|nr:YbaB/EbfC family nucleoid-associated protein [Oscillospiraceae bacterium]